TGRLNFLAEMGNRFPRKVLALLFTGNTCKLSTAEPVTRIAGQFVCHTRQQSITGETAFERAKPSSFSKGFSRMEAVWVAVRVGNCDLQLRITAVCEKLKTIHEITPS